MSRVLILCAKCKVTKLPRISMAMYSSHLTISRENQRKESLPSPELSDGEPAQNPPTQTTGVASGARTGTSHSQTRYTQLCVSGSNNPARPGHSRTSQDSDRLRRANVDASTTLHPPDAPLCIARSDDALNDCHVILGRLTMEDRGIWT